MKPLLLLLLLLTSCATDRLMVRSEVVDEEFLASHHCSTPDYFRRGCFLGEQLVIGWRVPEYYIKERGARLVVVIRYRNQEVQTYTIPIRGERAQCIYRLIGCDYFATEGILTYKAEIVAADGEVLESWRHHVWVEYIGFADDEDGEDEFNEVDSSIEAGEG